MKVQLRRWIEKTMTSIISATPYNLYPDAAYEQFKEAYAKFYGLSPEQIIAGNGSDELIQKLMLIMPEGPAINAKSRFFYVSSICGTSKS